MYLHLYKLHLCYELPHKLKSLRDITNVDTMCYRSGEKMYILVRPSLSVHCSLKITTLSDRYWPLKKHLAFPQRGSNLSD